MRLSNNTGSYLNASIMYELTAAPPLTGLGFQIKATLFLVTSVTRGTEGGPGRRLGSGSCAWRSAPFSGEANVGKGCV